LEYYIGKAKATKRDIKTGKPYWLTKGKYDLDYKNNRSYWRETKVYERTPERDKIYLEWKAQYDKANGEMRKADKIAETMKN
jgi:hypothetical protein